MADVVLSEVHKAYGTNPVVRGLSLAMASGEFVSLLGPSGCGKTTTLRMIAGLERADRGELRIGGELVDDGTSYVPPEKRQLGMVFQSYAVWPHRSVAENVAYPLTLQRLGKSEIEARTREALEWVRLGALAHRRPHELSGGQLQRVSLARALVAKPRVLLLDEPLSNLDATLREEMRAEIAGLRARVRTTMIYVTHDQAEALALSDRIAVMNHGVIEQLASPTELYRNPKTAFVAGFVGGANLLVGVHEGEVFATSGVRFGVPPDPLDRRGAGQLAVRAEDVTLAHDGTPLPLVAKLFLGHATEYRLAVGDTLLRAVGPHTDARPGQLVPVRIQRATFFP